MAPEIRDQSAQSAAELLRQHALFQQSRHIACYIAYGSEFLTRPLIETIWQEGKICYLPVLTDTKSLQFVQYNAGDELQPNQHFIPEPVNHQHSIQPEKLDLVITPLVAFDLQGNRLGTGGGYYDRTFAFMYTHPVKAPFLLGLGFDMQQSDAIPSEPWDIKLNGVLTETRVFIF